MWGFLLPGLEGSDLHLFFYFSFFLSFWVEGFLSFLFAMHETSETYEIYE